MIRTPLLVTAIEMASLIDSYCIVYTDNPHSRLTDIKRFSNSQMYVYQAKDLGKGFPYENNFYIYAHIF